VVLSGSRFRDSRGPKQKMATQTNENEKTGTATRKRLVLVTEKFDRNGDRWVRVAEEASDMCHLHGKSAVVETCHGGSECALCYSGSRCLECDVHVCRECYTAADCVLPTCPPVVAPEPMFCDDCDENLCEQCHETLCDARPECTTNCTEFGCSAGRVCARCVLLDDLPEGWRTCPRCLYTWCAGHAPSHVCV